jgi:hypothetical protein
LTNSEKCAIIETQREGKPTKPKGNKEMAKRMVNITFVSWEHNGEQKERTQEHYDVKSVIGYVKNLDLTKVHATTHFHDKNGDLVDIVFWNDLNK